MSDFLKLAEILGKSVHDALAPLKIQIETLNEKIKTLEAEKISEKETLSSFKKTLDEVESVNKTLSFEFFEAKGAFSKEIEELLESKEDAKKEIDRVLSEKFATSFLELEEVLTKALNSKSQKIRLELGEELSSLVKSIPVPKEIQKNEVVEAVALSFEKRFGEQAIGWERRASEAIGKAIESLPAPKDGKDGLSLDDLEVKLLDRELVFKLGERTEKFKLDLFKFQSDWKAEKVYQKGDIVVAGGSSHIAVKESEGERPGASDSWKMLVKRGRDGRDGQLTDLREDASDIDKSKGISFRRAET